MDLLIYLLTSIIVIIVTIILIKKRNKINGNLIIALTGMTVALSVLIFPLYKENNLISQIVFSILYALQAIFLGQDFELIGIVELNNYINLIYIIIVYILFLLQPLMTATVIISFFGSSLSKIKMILYRNKEAVVFSEINEKTLTIAKTQYNKSKNIIIFLGDKEDNIECKGIILNQKITDINLKNNKITYYLFSSEHEKNLNDALDILNNNDSKKDIKMYVLNNTEEARIILDSANKNGIKLELINEIDRVIYQQIYNEPIYRNAINNQISILIVGCGRVGLEFLKAVTWCGQLINHKLNINIIDIKADVIKQKLDIECPELLSNYQYNFIEADIYSKKAINELDKLKEQNINYVLVALNKEEENLNVAIFLRKYFMQQDTTSYSRKPIINLWIENDNKRKQIDSLKYSSNANLYNLNAFGSIKDMYEYNSIVNSEVENLAKQVHGVYDPEDINNNLERFYNLEYNKKSSRAVAVHLKYKIYSILKDNYNGNIEYDLDYNMKKVLSQYNLVSEDEKIKYELIKNEHERWNAYTRTDGYKVITADDVQKYYDKTKNSKHFLARLHPALVPFEQLFKVGEKLGVDYISSDKNIIDNIDKILKKEIYKK